MHSKWYFVCGDYNFHFYVINKFQKYLTFALLFYDLSPLYVAGMLNP
jgi:hypothetical protein